MRGRVSPLIELGAGFHPDFSGRENVYLNGLVIGMSKAETEQRFDSIVEFAGLADAIDDPVRTYSSGMYMRLGFSVAVHADPDVLVDRRDPRGRRRIVRHSLLRAHRRVPGSVGKTLVLVSHSLESIERWCHEAVWIDEGRVAARGYPTEVTRLYHAAVGAEGAAPAGERSLRDSLRPGRLAAVIRVLEPPARTPEPWHTWRACCSRSKTSGTPSGALCHRPAEAPSWSGGVFTRASASSARRCAR